jgi:hypothetical protein
MRRGFILANLECYSKFARKKRRQGTASILGNTCAAEFVEMKRAVWLISTISAA